MAAENDQQPNCNNGAEHRQRGQQRASAATQQRQLDGVKNRAIIMSFVSARRCRCWYAHCRISMKRGFSAWRAINYPRPFHLSFALAGVVYTQRVQESHIVRFFSRLRGLKNPLDRPPCPIVPGWNAPRGTLFLHVRSS